jgi:hypothetical protein
VNCSFFRVRSAPEDGGLHSVSKKHGTLRDLRLSQPSVLRSSYYSVVPLFPRTSTSRRWRHDDPSKRRVLLTQRHSVTSLDVMLLGMAGTNSLSRNTRDATVLAADVVRMFFTVLELWKTTCGVPSEVSCRNLHYRLWTTPTNTNTLQGRFAKHRHCTLLWRETYSKLAPDAALRFWLVSGRCSFRIPTGSVPPDKFRNRVYHKMIHDRFIPLPS